MSFGSIDFQALRRRKEAADRDDERLQLQKDQFGALQARNEEARQNRMEQQLQSLPIDANLDKLRPPGIDADRLDRVKEVNRLRKLERDRREGAQGRAGLAQQGAALSEGTGDAQTQAGFNEGILGIANDPRALNEVSGGIRQQQASIQAEDLVRQKTADSGVSASARLARVTRDEEGLIEDTLGFFSEKVRTGDDDPFNATVDALVGTDRFESVGEAIPFVMKYAVAAGNRAVETQMKLRSVNQGENVRLSEIDDLTKGFENIANSIGAEITDRHEFERQVRQVFNGRAIYYSRLSEELGEMVIIDGSVKDQQQIKLKESSDALINSLDQLGLAEESFFLLKSQVEAGEDVGFFPVGPLIGADRFQDLARLLGNQNPLAATYARSSFLFISALLKATQGARPSDFDLKMFRALLPSLTEVAAPSGPAAFVLMRKAIKIQMRAFVNDDMASAVVKSKRGQTAGDRRLGAERDRLVGILDDEDISQADKAQAVASFAENLDALNTAQPVPPIRGFQSLRLDGNATQPPVSKEAQELLGVFQ